MWRSRCVRLREGANAEVREDPPTVLLRSPTDLSSHRQMPVWPPTTRPNKPRALPLDFYLRSPSTRAPRFFPAMTKIVGTLGPKSRSVEVITACLKAGMSGKPRILSIVRDADVLLQSALGFGPRT
ncbi:hypothetical protein GW17_00021340 [Ensete ventricosum]|nr:hypothetical protein GW17_00021340 [Ensete ventricosum]